VDDISPSFMNLYPARQVKIVIPVIDMYGSEISFNDTSTALCLGSPEIYHPVIGQTGSKIDIEGMVRTAVDSVPDGHRANLNRREESFKLLAHF
jgi:hypothetical protein